MAITWHHFQAGIKLLFEVKVTPLAFEATYPNGSNGTILLILPPFVKYGGTEFFVCEFDLAGFLLLF